MGHFRVDVKGKGCREGSTWSVSLGAPGTVVNVRGVDADSEIVSEEWVEQETWSRETE